LDDFLFKPDEEQPLQRRIDQVLKWLPDELEATVVQLLTKAVGTPSDMTNILTQFEERAAIINRASRYRSRALVVEVKFTLHSKFPYVHDRFAIIDDELWHFGATVGGLHNLVNAASRGWDVDEHGAVSFFERAWSANLDGGQDHHSRARRRRGGEHA